MELHTYKFYGNTLTLNFAGSLDAEGSKNALSLINKALSDPEFNEIEVDLTNVSFLDSSGIGAIVYLYKRLIASNRNMRIENVSGQPLEIFNLLRINHAIPINSKQLHRDAC